VRKNKYNVSGNIRSRHLLKLRGLILSYTCGPHKEEKMATRAKREVESAIMLKKL